MGFKDILFIFCLWLFVYAIVNRGFEGKAKLFAGFEIFLALLIISAYILVG